MAVNSISFWQQDANYWNRAQARDQQLAQSDALISAMGDAITTQSSGLASIANQTALNRVNSALTAAIQSALQQSQSGSTDSSSGSGTSSNSPGSSTASSSASSSTAPSSSTASSPTPATGTGTVLLSANTSLLTLGIPESGTITVSDGTNTTDYSSTGTDTVNDLINAINTNVYGNAQVNAWLDPSGHLVISAKNTTDPVTVGGIFASNVGFGGQNDTFQPTAPPASSSNSANAANSASSSGNAASPSSSTSSSAGASGSSAAGSNGSSASSSAATTNSTSSSLLNSAIALQSGGTAEYLLASSGLGGTLLNMLA